ncbi:MAG: beta-galactosidase [Paludisphaera borealis]|uniref:beta-galactosidase n=1 Tax=Paludisphaera borealis TaxID=1387353 RepID=UPI0028447D2F|nr:beta-galactosidase [Paludisphaera borealis]MDR3623188.1 beta-galactosidase [Paludisphaera borealis]
MRNATIVLLALAMLGCPARADEPRFTRGLPTSADFFPVAVWLQSPSNARKYKDVGINVYVGLYRGPTAEQLDALDAAGIRVFAGQNRAALGFKDRPTIVGWLQDDEPDNAQELHGGKGYGPPVTPEAVVKRYHEIQQADPTRPVMLNLGQGVAWDGWYGRGVRTNHPEDYPEYIKGCDIVSFDIYPACSTDKAIAGKLEYVPQGVDRLKKWTAGRKPVWCCIETTGINNVNRKPTPAEVRSEVWMALIHGANGILYFAHQFKPKFIEAGLLADESIAREVAAVNRRIKNLAPVLNSPDVPDAATVVSSNKDVPIAFVVKRHDGATYLFAVSMRDGETTATIQLSDKADAKVEVLDEDRALDARSGAWADKFIGYQAHLYRIK